MIQVSLAVGFAVALPFAFKRWRCTGDFDAGATLLVFLGGASLPNGVMLIYCAWTENVALAPGIWPIYFAAAGMIGIGLTARALQKAFSETATQEKSLPSRPPIAEPGAE